MSKGTPPSKPTRLYPVWLFVTLFTLQFLILALTIVLLVRKTPEPTPVYKDGFCNCFGPQYDGSAADPSKPTCDGGYCYSKPKMSAEYAAGAFSKTFQGV